MWLRRKPGTGLLSSILSHKQWFEILLSVSFHTLFVLAYSNFLNPEYEYYGFTQSLSPGSLILSYLLLAAVYVSLPGDESRVGGVALRLLFALLVMPTLGLYAVTAQSTLFLLSVVLAFVLSCWVVQKKTRNYIHRIERLLLGRCVTSRRLAAGGVVLFSVLTYASILASNGPPPLTAFSLSEVYKVREQFNYGFFGLSYLVMWQAKVINPFLVGAGWYYRRPSVAGVASLLQLIIYLYTGHKLFLFGFALVLFVLYSVNNGTFLTGLLRSIAVAAVGALLLFSLTEDSYAPYLIIGRTYFLTAEIQYNYFEFFSNNRFVYLSNSKLGFFMPDQYERQIPEIIGDTYYGADVYANGSVFANAFSHFGHLGVVLFGGALGLTLNATEWVSEQLPTAIALATVVIPVYSLTQTGLTTVLLTHGLLPAVALLFVYRDTSSPKA